jgi:hypothetical protein
MEGGRLGLRSIRPQRSYFRWRVRECHIHGKYSSQCSGTPFISLGQNYTVRCALRSEVTDYEGQLVGPPATGPLKRNWTNKGDIVQAHKYRIRYFIPITTFLSLFQHNKWSPAVAHDTNLGELETKTSIGQP